MTWSFFRVSSEERNLPIYDGLNEVDIFFNAFEMEVPQKQCFQALDWALRATPSRWWGTLKGSFDDWRECRRMMRTQFGKPKMWLTDNYDGHNDPRAHLAKWTQADGEKPQLEWVHLFCHILDVVPMNWYIETKLCHGTGKWDILREGFMMTFSFKDGFDSIDEVLQEVKASIFRIS